MVFVVVVVISSSWWWFINNACFSSSCYVLKIKIFFSLFSIHSIMFNQKDSFYDSIFVLSLSLFFNLQWRYAMPNLMIHKLCHLKKRKKKFFCDLCQQKYIIDISIFKLNNNFIFISLDLNKDPTTTTTTTITTTIISVCLDDELNSLYVFKDNL